MFRVDTQKPADLVNHLRQLEARNAQRQAQADQDLVGALDLLSITARHSGDPDLVMQIARTIAAIMPQPRPLPPEAQPGLELFSIINSGQARLTSPDLLKYVVLTREELEARDGAWQVVDGVRYTTVDNLALLFDGEKDPQRRARVVRSLFDYWRNKPNNNVESSRIGPGHTLWYSTDTIDRFLADRQDGNGWSSYNLPVKKN